MEITILDQILLLITGLTAVYLIFRLFQNFKSTGAKHNIHYMYAFAVLFVAGVLMIFGGFDVLSWGWIGIVATLLPFGIAMGLVCQFYPKYKKAYLAFLVIGLVSITLLKLGVIDTKVVYPVFHSVAGLTIFMIPILAVKSKAATKGFIWVTVGGTIIGIGGVALAFLGAGKPLLGIFTADVVFAILTSILLFMTLGFTYGFMKEMNK